MKRIVLPNATAVLLELMAKRSRPLRRRAAGSFSLPSNRSLSVVDMNLKRIDGLTFRKAMANSERFRFLAFAIEWCKGP